MSSTYLANPHLHRTNLTHSYLSLGVLGGVLVVLLLVAVICVPVVLGLRRKGRSIASNPITSTGE